METDDQAVPMERLTVSDRTTGLEGFGWRYLEWLRAFDPVRFETLRTQRRLLARARERETEADRLFSANLADLVARGVSPTVAVELLTPTIEGWFEAKEREQ